MSRNGAPFLSRFLFFRRRSFRIVTETVEHGDGIVLSRPRIGRRFSRRDPFRGGPGPSEKLAIFRSARVTASSSFVSAEIRESCHNFRLPGKRVACYSPRRLSERDSFPRGSVELAARTGNRSDILYLWRTLLRRPFDPYRSPTRFAGALTAEVDCLARRRVIFRPRTRTAAGV